MKSISQENLKKNHPSPSDDLSAACEQHQNSGIFANIFANENEKGIECTYPGEIILFIHANLSL